MLELSSKLGCLPLLASATQLTVVESRLARIENQLLRRSPRSTHRRPLHSRRLSWVPSNLPRRRPDREGSEEEGGEEGGEGSEEGGEESEGGEGEGEGEG